MGRLKLPLPCARRMNYLGRLWRMWRFYGRIVRGSEISFVISSGDIGVDSRRKPTIAVAQESFSLYFPRCALQGPAEMPRSAHSSMPSQSKRSSGTLQCSRRKGAPSDRRQTSCLGPVFESTIWPTLGPVAPLFRFDSETEVMEAANATPLAGPPILPPARSGQGYARLLAIADGLVPQNKVAIASKLSPFRGRQVSLPGKPGTVK